MVEAADNLLWYPVQYEGLEESPCICYTGGCLNQQIMPLVEWALSKFGKRIFLVGSDYVFPRTANQLIHSLVTDHGGSVVAEHYVELGAQDFSGIIAAVKQTRPDVLINTINGDSNLAFYRQYHAAGLLPDKIPIIATSVAETELEPVVAAAAGHFACWDYFQSLDTPANREFVSRFKGRFGENRLVSAPTAKAYIQIYLWKQAVECANTFEPSAVRRCLAGTTWGSPIGRARIEDNHHLSIPIRIGRLKPDGQFEIVWGHDDPIAPLPWLGLEGMNFPAKTMLKSGLASFADGIDYAWRLEHEIAQRQLLEAALQKANVGLEGKVAERSRQLEQTIKSLQEEIKSHQGAETKLRDSRIAALNMMEDAVEARRIAEQQSIAAKSELAARMKAQAELVSKTAFLEAQVDSTIDGILVVDENEKKILQNRRLLDLFKVPEHIARDSDDTKLLQHVTKQMKNPKQFVERVAHLYAHPDEVGRDEIELADGKILDRYSAPVLDKAGKHYGRIWTFRDVTQQRTLEEQIRQSQKMEVVGQLASGVAHDFNNILAVIQLQSELLKTEASISPKHSGYASEIGEAAQRAAALIRQLLLFSRKEKMQTRELDLNQSINDMTKMLRRTLGDNIELQFKFALQPLFVQADAGMMDQVLMNLAVNARDAMPKGGNLIIQTSALELDELSSSIFVQSRPGSFVCLSVSDTGTGIPPEILPKIFEPFFTTKAVGKGTGLGLATVFGIVQPHLGWINVYSEVGRGTTFRVYLPRLARISDQKFVAPTEEEMPGGKETILVVEDEPKLRASVINLLTGLGYKVLEAFDGADALEVWRKHRNQIRPTKKAWDQQLDEIHLLLTDLVMPGGMTGKDLGEELLKENPKLKVIYVSGYSTEVAGKDFPLQEGINFLTKPFQAQKLAQTIRNCLNGG